MDSVCSRAVQTAGNLHVQTIIFFSVLFVCSHAYGKTTLGLGKHHSLFQCCESLALHKVSLISQMFSNSIPAISSLAIAWSEHDASIGPIFCPPKGLTLALKTKREGNKSTAFK